MARVLNCDDCGKTPNVVELHEMLCAECMFTRAAARDVRLSLASLPCEFNLMCSPVSWFELFASIEIRPPNNLDAWRAVAARFPNAPTALREDAMKMELN
jgi:hypothetical protein